MIQNEVNSHHSFMTEIAPPPGGSEAHISTAERTLAGYKGDKETTTYSKEC